MSEATTAVNAAKATEKRILADPAELSRAAAEEFLRLAPRNIASSGQFTVSLAGGSTPRAAYEILAQQPEKIFWDKVYIFFGDERCVPPEHQESNYGMARAALLAHVPIPSQNVHRMRGELDPAAAAEQYDQDLRGFFRLGRGEFPSFDLIMLGMGDDGHTASLFPGSDALRETSRLAVANWVEKFHQHRLTLTFPVLNNAAEVMFLVAGAAKAKVLGEIFGENAPRDRYPVQKVKPAAGRTLWLLDRAAVQSL